MFVGLLTGQDHIIYYTRIQYISMKAPIFNVHSQLLYIFPLQPVERLLFLNAVQIMGESNPLGHGEFVHKQEQICSEPGDENGLTSSCNSRHFNALKCKMFLEGCAHKLGFQPQVKMGKLEIFVRRLIARVFVQKRAEFERVSKN